MAPECDELSDNQARHAMNELTGSLALLMENHGDLTHDVSSVAERFIEAIQRTAPPQPHPLAKAALGGVVTITLACLALAYGYGSLNTRVAQLERLEPRVVETERRTEGIGVLASKIDDLRHEIDRLMTARVSSRAQDGDYRPR